MHPILIEIGILKIYSYGFFIAVAFLAGINLARREAARLDESPERITDLCFYILILAVIGARFIYVITEPKPFLENPLEIFKIWKGGLVFYGGFLFVFIFSLIYLKKHRMNLWKTTDILAPSLILGQAIGRIGCFSAGCCYGKPTDLPWAITFHDPNSLAPTGIALHPTQIYTSLNNFLIFAFLWYFRKRKRFNGQVTWLYVFLYGITRAIIELFRGDPRGPVFFGMISVSQAIGIAMAMVSIFMLYYLGNKKKSIHSGSAKA